MRFIKGVGPARAKILREKFGILSVWDLLYHLPFKYEDRRFLPIGEVLSKKLDSRGVAVAGKITNAVVWRDRSGKEHLDLLLCDRSGCLWVTLFGRGKPHVRRLFRIGMEMAVYGKLGINARTGKPSVVAEDLELLRNPREGYSFFGKILPVYRATAKLPSKVLWIMVLQALRTYGDLIPDEILPRDVVAKYGLMDLRSAIFISHNPPMMASPDEVRKARARLVFEELFLLQVGILAKRMQEKAVKAPPMHEGRLTVDFRRNLPFKLTGAQEKVINEIFEDMKKEYPMNRLLQGDVGSGKTVVAMFAALRAIENGFQVAYMAPTEILAEQHFATALRLLRNTGVKVGLLVGSLSDTEKMETRKLLMTGKIDIIFGTHTLLQRGTSFRNLGLVIIDEQHRFGVIQRALLIRKGQNPHVLVMTATPIPRSLALTMYGDLDLSILDELPPGRKPVKTYWYRPREKGKAYDRLMREIASGHQGYVVAPLIEESENLQTQAVESLYEELRERYPGVRFGLVHGNMRRMEREQVMQSFRMGKIQVLVATTVIEVGIDVPNATVIIIEGADRFGLSQLHQLRGRVCRSHYQPFCFLIADPKTPEAIRRMEIMISTNDGFKIAEEDLKLRGPGQLLGTKQHGHSVSDLKVADVVKHRGVLEVARKEAEKYVSRFKTIEELMADPLFAEVLARFGEGLHLSRVG